MNQEVSNCPVCQKDNAYFDGTLNVCPDCSHEWDVNESVQADK
ncbi:MAG: alkylphosphonate utilization protein, partial [Bacteroidales bacterium]